MSGPDKQRNETEPLGSAEAERRSLLARRVLSDLYLDLDKALPDSIDEASGRFHRESWQFNKGPEGIVLGQLVLQGFPDEEDPRLEALYKRHLLRGGGVGGSIDLRPEGSQDGSLAWNDRRLEWAIDLSNRVREGTALVQPPIRYQSIPELETVAAEATDQRAVMARRQFNPQRY